MYGEKPRKVKAYIMAQAHQQLQVSGKKTPAIRIILQMIRIRMDNYKSNDNTDYSTRKKYIYK